MTEKAKWKAVVADIKERQERGQPVLVGTVAIETSERLSKLLDRAGVEHQVLNAKQHEREAVIIAQAGRPGAVTIATNMAGRGVDILLGGNPEGLAREKLRKRTASTSPRPRPSSGRQCWPRPKPNAPQDRDKVLARGRAVRARHGTPRSAPDRQPASRAVGPPGRSRRESRFYLSLEDDLMRRFGGDRVKGFMKWADMPEDMPIEHKADHQVDPAGADAGRGL